MYEFKKLHNFLTDEEIIVLNDYCKNYKEDGFQIYSMQQIKENDLLDFKNKIQKYVADTYKLNYILNPLWLNRVSSMDENSDKFHFDHSDLSIVTYFDTNFKGGNFEYYDEANNIVSITPEKNLSILMNNKLTHRITKVTNGVRFSLVAFFDFKPKNTKTFL